MEPMAKGLVPAVTGTDVAVDKEIVISNEKVVEAPARASDDAEQQQGASNNNNKANDDDGPSNKSNRKWIYCGVCCVLVFIIIAIVLGLTLNHETRLEGEPCGFLYKLCDSDLMCHEGACVGLEQFFEHGPLGTCIAGHAEGTVKVMTYNIFLINCLLGGIFLACQDDAGKAARVPKITDWFANRDEDVVVFQEVFSYDQEIKAGMTAAGFCHFVTTTKGTSGSGLAIYSKFPIVYTDFIDWFDAFGPGESTSVLNFEAYADKGVLYTKILKQDKHIHIFNTHTQSDSAGDMHDVRLSQFETFHNFILRQNIPEDELILLSGDFNEDKYYPNPLDLQVSFEGDYYKEMLHVLDAAAFPIHGNNTHTQNTEQNPFLAQLWEDTEFAGGFKLLLDYVLAFKQGMTPANSSYCEILIPEDPVGGMLSDHFPMTCTILEETAE